MGTIKNSWGRGVLTDGEVFGGGELMRSHEGRGKFMGRGYPQGWGVDGEFDGDIKDFHGEMGRGYPHGWGVDGD
jgi:hypothetical protein